MYYQEGKFEDEPNQKEGYTYINVCKHIYMYIYIYVCVCIYIYIYTHTHTHNLLEHFFFIRRQECWQNFYAKFGKMRRKRWKSEYSILYRNK